MRYLFSFAFVLGLILLRNFGLAAERFDQKHSQERQIVQALNRLTFGPRPGDVDEVRRIGLTKWIEHQLHPDQVAENPVLEQRLAPLTTLRMPVSEIVPKYSPDPNMGMMIMMEPPFAVLNRLP